MTSLPRRILLATDGSEEAKLLAGPAVEFARSTGSELHLGAHQTATAYPTLPRSARLERRPWMGRARGSGVAR